MNASPPASERAATRSRIRFAFALNASPTAPVSESILDCSVTASLKAISILEAWSAIILIDVSELLPLSANS